MNFCLIGRGRVNAKGAACPIVIVTVPDPGNCVGDDFVIVSLVRHACLVTTAIQWETASDIGNRNFADCIVHNFDVRRRGGGKEATSRFESHTPTSLSFTVFWMILVFTV